MYSDGMANDGEAGMTADSPNRDASGFTYITIPALDVHESGRFYQAVFGWTTRGGDHHLGFTDEYQSIRGAFETSLAISREPGVLPYIFVSDIDRTLELVTRHGGSIVRPRYAEGGLWVATFRDVAGNVLGIWQARPS
jgi:uncharacterized protein